LVDLGILFSTVIIIRMNDEEAVVKAFISPSRQERYLGFLKKPKLRSKFTGQLAHFNALDPRFVRSIPADQQTSSSVAKLLRLKGAGDECWVISENRELDSRNMNLETALQAVVGYGLGTFLSCLPGRLAYFESEDSRCILER
jgi:hypothetical protein